MKVTFSPAKKAKQNLDAASNKGDAGRRISIISVWYECSRQSYFLKNFKIFVRFVFILRIAL